MGKYAVVVGINYIKNPEAALKGCCNDARIIAKILESKGFESENVKMIVDDDDSCADPSGAEVKKALNWLCTNRSQDDIIFFHFSGHGTQIPSDGDDEEEDAKDEAIVLEQMFLMADDDLKMFFSKLPEGCKATVITDCCHSGSMLDGKEIAIEGAKDNASLAPMAESASLLSILGGSRAVDQSVARSLPIGTIANILGGKLGTEVPPTGNGVNGALAQVFGGDAGKLMLKFALSKLNGGAGKGGSAPLAALAGSLLGGSGGGGSAKAGGDSGGKPDVMGMLGGFLKKDNSGGGGGLGGLFGKPQQEKVKPQNPLAALLSGGDPMSNLSNVLGGLGLEGQEPVTNSGAPPYKPTTESINRDVAVLITGCQAHETSADVTPPGGESFGALTKTLSDVYTANPNATFYQLVSSVRAELSKGGFKQNPCLECSRDNANRVFIC